MLTAVVDGTLVVVGDVGSPVVVEVGSAVVVVVGAAVVVVTMYVHAMPSILPLAWTSETSFQPLGAEMT